ncbi:hypothetical protein [Sinanaerobacter chloroacetimidivorans]|uniref:Uncharacterized protein n=1 Tax=Sinanaerobacter chloroacetimidivorans TaxID=2818044 RepID=A0A8J8B029_9FIRM|nr:hypothetical protein [Sinanaerobacter chloroacetimidivorans]MBR0597158.1 hypothetical protein [Sinanaerobacter chloroacetimidivorans]
MNHWTEQEALKALKGNVHTNHKHISCYGGFYGLRACSAFDYLCDHCGYQVNDMQVKTSVSE